MLGDITETLYSLQYKNIAFIAIQIYCVYDTVITGAFPLNLLAHLATDFNKHIITIFDALFGTLHAISAHYICFLVPLATLMCSLAQGAAKKNTCIKISALAGTT